MIVGKVTIVNVAAAVERENMRFVPIKTEDRIDLQLLPRVPV
ncbi:MAG: hypothetical protein WB729_05800 [Candidatus Sulfotelmatobacter sp.]